MSEEEEQKPGGRRRRQTWIIGSAREGLQHRPSRGWRRSELLRWSRSTHARSDSFRGQRFSSVCEEGGRGDRETLAGVSAGHRAAGFGHGAGGGAHVGAALARTGHVLQTPLGQDLSPQTAPACWEKSHITGRFILKINMHKMENAYNGL